MKIFKILYVIVTLVFSAQLIAQVPNGGFENWAAGEPDFWTTNNSDPYFTVTQSNSSHSGSSALKGECIAFVPPFLPVMGPVGICDGDTDEGFPIEFRYNSLKGFFKFNPLGGDQIYISLLLIADTAAIGVGSILLNGAASYTDFAIPITYIDASAPNKCIISFQILNPLGGVNVTLGSEMYLDDLELSMDVVSIKDEEIKPLKFQLEQNYPNPFNPTTTIGYVLDEKSNTKLTIINSIGEEVTILVNQEQDKGYYKVDFNASNLSSGIYFYKLRTGSFVEIKKMILLK